MWTEQSRGRMARIAKKTKRYPSDLTDEEWEQIAPLMPKPGRRGRPREVEFREVVNAVRYLVRSGCGWRMLPIHFGPWQTVYGWFRELARRFLFQTIHDLALMLDREQAGREASPSGGVIDSQSVKAPAANAQRGYDAGKKIVGRKRHIAVDTDGRLLMVNLTPADISDSAGAQMILDGVRKRWPWLNICSPMGPMIAPNSWTKPPSGISPSRSSSDPTPPWASKSSPVDGSSSARSPG